MLNEVPDRVVQLVQEMLDQGQTKEQGQNTSSSATSRASAKPPKGRKVSVTNKSTDQSPPSESKGEPKATVTLTLPEKRVILNIWDFSGKAIYYTTHQVNIIQYTIISPLQGKLERAISFLSICVSVYPSVIFSFLDLFFCSH